MSCPSLALIVAGSLTMLMQVTACATGFGPGSGFNLHFPDNRGRDVGAIASVIASRPVEEDLPVVIVSAPAPARGFSVFALPGGQRLWQTATRIDSRPAITGSLLVAHSQGQVFAWDVRTGQERWHVPDHGFSLIGASGDGASVALSLGPGGIRQRRGVFLVVDARSGSTRFERTVEQALGVPAMAGGYAFVPWNGQYLTMVDVRAGSERARIRTGDDLFSRAFREGNAVYFGARALYRLSAASAGGQRQGSGAFTVPRQDLPGNPPLFTDGYTASHSGVNARERVAVLSRPDPTQPGAHMLDDTIYALFYRTVFALDARSGAVRWAYVHAAADIAGATPVRGGFVFVDERGTAAMLDLRAGNPVYTHALGTPAAQAVISVPVGFAPPRDGQEPAHTPASSLIAAAGGTDTRLLPARLFAARSLAGLPGEEATRGLLDIAGRRAYPQELRAVAGESLGHRTEGLDAMLAALGTHADYLRQTEPPPVGFIARALVNAHERRAIAPLIAHLSDPETPATELPPLVGALRDFADPSAIPALLDFVRLYHADEGIVPPLGEGEGINDRSLPEQQAINSALELAIMTLAQAGGPPERRWLEALFDDVNTLEAVRTVIRHALDGGSPAVGGSSSPSVAGQTAPTTTAPEEEVEDPNIPPNHLTPEMIAAGFDPVRGEMMHCLDGMTSRPAQVRLTFRYDGEGHVSNVMVAPTTLQRCIESIVPQVRLRTSQTPRDIGNFYLLGGPL